MRETYEVLGALRATVRECLAALDGAAPTDPEVGQVFDRLATGFEELGDPVALLRAAPAAERERLEGELSDLTRLHAVLIAAVAKDRERLGCMLERSRTSRAALRDAATTTHTGGSYDRCA